MGILEQFSLEGKSALVTGCRRGIGMGIAVGLAEAGADIIGVSKSLELSGSEVEGAVTALGRSFKAYQCDFADRRAVYGFIEVVKKECPDDYWDTILEVNLTAQFVLAREFGKEMVARGKGKIIFTASLLTFQGGITVPGYAASKGGVGQLTKALANEWAPHGVNVNAVAPGYIATDNTQALRDNPTRSRQILERIPVGRWGTPDDFKGVSVFLASEASNYMNGAIVLVDGGWMAR